MCFSAQAIMSDFVARDEPHTLDAAQEMALSMYHSGSNVALFGRAGCGKSEVLRRIVLAATSRWGKDAVAVTALAGSAALVIGGQTLYSLFGMDTRPLSREAWLRITMERPSVCKRLNALRVLVVDEICTLPASLFGRLGFVMRRVAPPHMQSLPFGGCQLVGAFRLVFFLLSSLRRLLVGECLRPPYVP